MKVITRRVFLWASLMVLAVVFAVCTSCSTLIGCVTSEHTTWNFVKAVGGIKVGDPQPVANGGWFVPVECDVSGLTAVTTKPTTLNSALVVKDVRWKADQDRILVWVVTCVVTDRHKDSHWNQRISLKGIKPGKYAVQYLNPDGTTAEIRSIQLHE